MSLVYVYVARFVVVVSRECVNVQRMFLENFNMLVFDHRNRNQKSLASELQSETKMCTKKRTKITDLEGQNEGR